MRKTSKNKIKAGLANIDKNSNICLTFFVNLCCIKKKFVFSFIEKGRPGQVFCYLTSWSAKRPGAGKFEPKDIDPKLCTHLVYAFATLKDHKLTEANEDDPENYDKLVEIRDKNPDIQVC